MLYVKQYCIPIDYVLDIGVHNASNCMDALKNMIM
jgi:hypothetical protein